VRKRYDGALAALGSHPSLSAPLLRVETSRLADAPYRSPYMRIVIGEAKLKFSGASEPGVCYRRRTTQRRNIAPIAASHDTNTNMAHGLSAGTEVTGDSAAVITISCCTWGALL
jgi:hypothetical protein